MPPELAVEHEQKIKVENERKRKKEKITTRVSWRSQSALQLLLIKYPPT